VSTNYPPGVTGGEPQVVGDDFLEYDALNVLALPLWRYGQREHYRVPGGWSGELRRAVYSNGTDQGFASEAAQTLMELGPMLARVLRAGVDALRGDADMEAYVTALAAGDHDEIVRLERAEQEARA
jgi:hypothetical protein